MKILYATVDDLRTNASHNIRNASLIKCLAESGNDLYLLFRSTSRKRDVSICETLKTYSVWSNVKDYSDNDSSIEQKKAAKTSLKSRIANIISKIIPYDPSIIYVSSLFKKALIPCDVDVIISSSDPNSSHVLGKQLKKKYPKALWIQYWGDVMSEDVQHKRIKRLLSSISEKKLIKKADWVVYTNPLVSNYIKAKYPFSKEKVLWIATPFGMSRNIKTSKDSFNKIGYFGSYSAKNRDISKICDASLLAKIPMVVIGEGTMQQIEGITFKKRCGMAELLEEEKSCTIVAIVENKYIRLSNGQNGCLQIPGKLYHYANSDFTILVACEGDMLEENYKDFKRFVFCKNNVADIVECLNRIKEGAYKSFVHPVKEFECSYISSQWEKLMKKVQ